MTILQFFASLLGVNADGLRAALQAGAQAAPDAAPLLNSILARFDEAITSESLASLAAAMPAELKQILLGHLDPRRHPSDLA